MTSHEIDLGIIAAIDTQVEEAEEAREVELTATGEVGAADLNNVSPATVPVVVDRLAALAAQGMAAQSCGPSLGWWRAERQPSWHVPGGKRFPLSHTGVL